MEPQGLTDARFPSPRYYVYVHSRPNGEPFYVGKGKNKRAWEFSRTTRTNHHLNVVNKYGQNNILVNIFDCGSEQAAFDVEKKLIKFYRDSGIVLLNMTDGGEGTSGHVPSEEWRIKQSLRLKGKPLHPNFLAAAREAHLGIPLKPETKAKIGAKSKGRKRKPETIMKMLKIHLGRKNSPETIAKMKASGGKTKGRKDSLETIAKKRLAAAKRPRPSPELVVKRTLGYIKACERRRRRKLDNDG